MNANSIARFCYLFLQLVSNDRSRQPINVASPFGQTRCPVLFFWREGLLDSAAAVYS